MQHNKINANYLSSELYPVIWKYHKLTKFPFFFFVTFIKVSLKTASKLLHFANKTEDIKWAYYFFWSHFLIKTKKYFLISIEDRGKKKSFVKFNLFYKEINIFSHSTFMHQFILQNQKTSANITSINHYIKFYCNSNVYSCCKSDSQY